MEYNKKHGITATSIKKNISESIKNIKEEKQGKNNKQPPKGQDLIKYIDSLRKQMLKSASELDFETAARIRDEIHNLEGKDMGLL